MLRHQSGDHCQPQRANQQLAQTLEQIHQHDKPRRRQSLRIGKPHPGGGGGQKTQCAEEHTERKLHRHSQIFAFTTQSGVNRCQYRTGDDHPEWVQRLKTHRVNGESKNFMMHVINRKEVQRGRHLRIQNVKQHGFNHQNKRHEHFIAAGFIQTKRFAKEENSDDDRKDDEHQIGNLNVVHQPGAEENHDDGAE